MDFANFHIDYRENGRVLQGPPMRAVVANAPAENPFSAVRLTEGRWVDESAGVPEVVCVRSSLKRFGRGKEPAIGEELVFILSEGRRGRALPLGSNGGRTKLVARVVGYLDGEKLPAMFPTVFANTAAFSTIPTSAVGSISYWRTIPKSSDINILTPSSPRVVAGFTGDEQRRMDYVTPLLMVASILTALALLVLSLLLSVESNRKTLSILRTIGATRFGIVEFVLGESFFAGAVGWIVGTAAAVAFLYIHVMGAKESFPAGVAINFRQIVISLFILLAVIASAALFALAPALRVRGGEASAVRPRVHRAGMAITFAIGFAAFVAVEVWGASMMRAFVPSPEWPDAIVSILPAGVRSSERNLAPLRKIPGVRRVGELVPLQIPYANGNILFLASEWLPEFKYVEGSDAEAQRLWREGKGVIISEITSRALNLHKGDLIDVGKAAFPIVGVVDLNWHMVTSRGLVRGLDGASPMTDGPAFVSFDALAAVDPRIAMVGPSSDPADGEVAGQGERPLTHLWVDYEEPFLEKHGVFGAGRIIESAIAEALCKPRNSTIRLHARDEIADGTLAHGSDIIGQVARVPFVFLAILALGFIAMLVAEAEARRSEFVVLRAVGATRALIAAKLAMSAMKTALIGMAAGLPVGALAGWLCTFNTGSWKGLPHWFVLPAGTVCEGAIVVLIVAMAFSIPTAMSIVIKATKR